MNRYIAPKGGPLRLIVVLAALVLFAPGWARNGQQVEIKVDRKEIPAPTIYEATRGLGPRQQKVVQGGSPGLRVISYTLIRDKSGTKKRIISDMVARPPQPKVVQVGINGNVASRGSFVRQSQYSTVKTITMNASAYEPGPTSCGRYATGRTALGWKAGYGIVAVDPKFIPLGTVLFIEGYGMAIAGDVGRAIKGNRIDLCFATVAECRKFGRRQVRVHILR